MIYYHGTTDTLFRAIQKDGLIYSPEHRWNITLTMTKNRGAFNPGRLDTPGYVYVTKLWQKALWYGANKALYLNTEPNTNYSFIPYNEMNGLDFESYSPARKETGIYIPGSNPVVLQVNVDEARLHRDRGDEHAYCVHGGIPPKDIKLVWEGWLAMRDRAA